MSAFLIVRLLEWCAVPLVIVYFLIRGLRDRPYRLHFGERLGKLPASFRQTAAGAVWLHAVSVGEVLSAVALLRRLRVELPRARLFVSVSTVAGREVADQKLRGLADGVFYAPIDFAYPVRRVLRQLRPRAVVVLETEIWPNLWREAKRFGCALVVVNGRISDRAMPRYRRYAWFFRQVLARPDAILAQSETSRARYAELGAREPQFAGNLKYDFTPPGAPPEIVRAAIDRTDPGAVWIAASTMPPAEAGDRDEDDAVLAAFREVAAAQPRLLLILVPRKPERFDAAAEKLRKAGIPFLRRSELRAGDAVPLPGVLLLDSIGELSSLFSLADVVFMGGTLARRGGHNLLEPAFFGKPIIAGPHMENFADIATRFETGGGVARIGSPDELAGAVLRLLRDPGLRGEIGERARALAESERGATGRAGERIARLYRAAVPCEFRSLAARIALTPLTRLWVAGGALKRRWRRPERLSTPVVSIGGLTVGGAGKTPIVLWLAERLERAAILMRGYRRQAAERVTLLGAGQHAPARLTGDEAQIYLRAGVAPLGIGADRAAAGRLAERRFTPRVFLLDDGFQHYRLARDLDLVVIDAIDPFGGGSVFPLGRLREPLEAVRRADVVVVSRLAPGESIAGIEGVLRKHGFDGPVYRASVVPELWIDAATSEPADPPVRAGAFCGLGNPESFWRTLDQAEMRTLFRRAFPDHHRYARPELDALAEGVDALLTTEKDIANLPEGWKRVPVLWLKVRVEIEDGEGLVARINERIRRSVS